MHSEKSDLFSSVFNMLTVELEYALCKLQLVPFHLFTPVRTQKTFSELLIVPLHYCFNALPNSKWENLPKPGCVQNTFSVSLLSSSCAQIMSQNNLYKLPSCCMSWFYSPSLLLIRLLSPLSILLFYHFFGLVPCRTSKSAITEGNEEQNKNDNKYCMQDTCHLKHSNSRFESS